MGKVVLTIEEPKFCSECPFVSIPEYFSDYDSPGHLYKRISRCRFAPESVKDPWRETHWQFEHKEEWCPLKPVEED